jgi:plasmid maintenance system antidote protein VapI
VSKNNKTPTLAEVLRTRIAASGQTTAALCRTAGIPQPVLSRFLRGKRDLTLRTAQKLIDLFGMTAT